MLKHLTMPKTVNGGFLWAFWKSSLLQIIKQNEGGTLMSRPVLQMNKQISG